MSAIALAIAAPLSGAGSPLLSDEFMVLWDRAPRGPLEPKAARAAEELDRALARDKTDFGEIARPFDDAVEVALALGHTAEARALCRKAVDWLARAYPASNGGAALALSTALKLGRVDRAEGRYDDALYLFERLAALPLGGSFEEGALSVGPAEFEAIGRRAPSLARRLSSAALAEALETLIRARRFDVALSVAKVRAPGDPAWLDAARREATATALCRMGLFGEALVFLSAAVAREPLGTRPIFEQKRAEALGASGQTPAAEARALFLAEALGARFREGPASLEDLVLCARTARLLAFLGHEESGRLACAALPHARALGDAPLAAELALRVVGGAGAKEERRAASEVLSEAIFSACEPAAPSYAGLRDKLLSLAA